MDEREFWVQVRRGLMTVVDVIERRYHLPRSTRYVGMPLTIPESTNGTTLLERASSQSHPIKEQD